MSSVKIYHNPRCSKSRQTLALLEDQGITPEIILYLENTPSAVEIEELITKLGLGTARDLIRSGEDAYKENGLANKELTQEQLVSAMVEFPKLIQRPIVINGNKAAIGRPPESVLDIL